MDGVIAWGFGLALVLLLSNHPGWAGIAALVTCIVAVCKA